jgi:cytochrome c oxidase assembly factor CtaG
MMQQTLILFPAVGTLSLIGAVFAAHMLAVSVMATVVGPLFIVGIVAILYITLNQRRKK